MEQEVRNPHEGWRVRFSDSILTFYKKGTIYSTPSGSLDPSVLQMWERINLLVGSPFCAPTREFLVGLDETGKGEVVGHTVLAGVLLPRRVFDDIDLLMGPADTKKRHTFEYWDSLVKKLDALRSSGVDWCTETIPPWQIDKYNINKMLDITYQRILGTFLRRCEIRQCRIVLDDYGVKETLRRFLKFLEQRGAEVVLTTKAEDSYLEAKIASLIAKRTREVGIKAINEKLEFRLDRMSVGKGSPSSGQTISWLQKWHATGKPWPWFVKKSFKTVREIEGKVGGVRKETPPFREELLSKQFLDEFNKGRLSVQSLSLVCPSCGAILTSVTVAMFHGNAGRISALKCPDKSCGKLIHNASFTLRYYCGYVVPDSSAIRRSVLSHDLVASKFFENFTVVLVPVVRKECDSMPRARKELDELRKYAGMGRIRLECPGEVADVPSGLSSAARDERIIESCLEWGAILLSADKPMTTFACGKGLFTIFVH